MVGDASGMATSLPTDAQSGGDFPMTEAGMYALLIREGHSEEYARLYSKAIDNRHDGDGMTDRQMRVNRGEALRLREERYRAQGKPYRHLRGKRKGKKGGGSVSGQGGEMDPSGLWG